MAQRAKHDLMTTALVQRLHTRFVDCAVDAAHTIVQSYVGKEIELYDTLAMDGPEALNVQSDPACMRKLHVSSANLICKSIEEGDIVEIASDASSKDKVKLQNSTLVRVTSLRLNADGARHIIGTLVAPTGEALELTTLLEKAPVIRNVNDRRGDYFVLSHPIAKSLFNRATKWFSCAGGTDAAERAAQMVKNQWQIELAKQAQKHRESHICLCSTQPCHEQANNHLLHVKHWTILKKGTFGESVMRSMGEGSASGLKKACVQAASDRDKQRRLN